MKKYDMIRIVRDNPKRLKSLTHAVPVTIKGDGPFEVLDTIDGNILFRDDTGEMQSVMGFYAEVVDDDIPSSLFNDDDYAMQILALAQVTLARGIDRDAFNKAVDMAWGTLTALDKPDQVH